ncbi:uncharacterized acetyltransferase-like protein [Tanacetum coccineum]|uniref:Uncharacterized acetyltransferase-like protein n=1 Tax=Tanacetum coccineum TaxID=301880 RepID=A0ABQ5JCV1_9ASTR
MKIALVLGLFAKVNVTIDDVLTPKDVPVIVQSFFNHDKAIDYDGREKSLLSIQVTELKDGVFIGCSINHMVVDGSSYWHFFNSWSEVFNFKGQSDDMDDIEMIMQQLQSEQKQEQAEESSHRRNYIYREREDAEEHLMAEYFDAHPKYPLHYFRKRIVVVVVLEILRIDNIVVVVVIVGDDRIAVVYFFDIGDFGIHPSGKIAKPRTRVGYKHTQLKNKSFEEIQRLFDKEMKRVNSFVPIDSEVVESSRKKTISKKRAGEELDEESVKRQKLKDDAEKAEL